jgi:two-component system cell cycle response regulator DivK
MSVNNKHILVVEDDSILGKIYVEILEYEGHRVTWIQDGRLALYTLRSLNPDLVLLDLHLPNVSGAEILASIRQDERLNEVKVVISTADGLQAQNLKETADLVLLKPVGYEQLAGLCNELFG